MDTDVDTGEVKGFRGWALIMGGTFDVFCVEGCILVGANSLHIISCVALLNGSCFSSVLHGNIQ